MSQAHRFLLVTIALLLAGGVVAVSQHTRGAAKPTAAPPPLSVPPSAGTACLPAQKRVAMPSFFPRDLPLPPGSYASSVPNAFAGSDRAVVIGKGTLREFIVYALTEWPKRGWLLGRGDAEPGEADDSFRDASAVRYGAFKARAIMCDASTTWVFFVFARATPAPSLGAPGGSSTPLVSPAPSSK